MSNTQFSDEELAGKLREILEGDRELGEAAIVDRLHQLGLITDAGRESAGWSQDREDPSLLTDDGHAFLRDHE
jgi:hypothetical protein